jgi:carbonic anhydrase
MTVIEEMLGNAERYAEAFDKGGLPMPPAKHVAVVACMDARLNPQGLLGLEEGDAHVVATPGASSPTT